MEIGVYPREKAVWHSNRRHPRNGAFQTAVPAAVETSSAAMKTLWRVLGLLFLALALTSLARAGLITITLDSNYPADYHSYTYTSNVTGKTYTEPTGPYPAILTGGIYGSGTPGYVVCFDMNVDTYVGQPYSGSLVTPSGTVQLEVAYLMAQLSQLGAYFAPVATVSGPISTAIWQLENSSSASPINPFPADPAAQPWISAAQTAVANHTWTAAMAAQYPFWSPDVGVVSQRFGIVQVAPEPGSLALVGASLIGLGFLLRKRLKNN